MKPVRLRHALVPLLAALAAIGVSAVIAAPGFANEGEKPACPSSYATGSDHCEPPCPSSYRHGDEYCGEEDECADSSIDTGEQNQKDDGDDADDDSGCGKGEVKAKRKSCKKGRAKKGKGASSAKKKGCKKGKAKK